MDKDFDFLTSSQVELLNEILLRRNTSLAIRVNDSEVISRQDAKQIVETLSEEFSNHLDDDWEPTEYGRTVSDILGQFNAARVAAWPE